jgi:hypothetical protein
MTAVIHPRPGFNGTVQGVSFVDGFGRTEDEAVLEHFRTAGLGYTVGSTVYATRVGNTLRDAAVDPRDSDFRAPTNAGVANPHGPDCHS